MRLTSHIGRVPAVAERERNRNPADKSNMGFRSSAVGILHHPQLLGPSQALSHAAHDYGLQVRDIDAGSLFTRMHRGGSFYVCDRDGRIEIAKLAPVSLPHLPSVAAAMSVLELNGAVAMNGLANTQAADDKVRSSVALAFRRVPQIPSVVVNTHDAWDVPIEKVGGYPFIAKLSVGPAGQFVRKLDTPDELSHVKAEFAAEGAHAAVLQPYIDEACGRTRRVLVIGGRAFAWEQRVAAQGGWKTNLSVVGARQEECDLSREERSLATGAVAALGLGVAGVDIIHTRRGSAVLEVNSYPDFTRMLTVDASTVAHEVIATLASLR